MEGVSSVSADVQVFLSFLLKDNESDRLMRGKKWFITIIIYSN